MKTKLLLAAALLFAFPAHAQKLTNDQVDEKADTLTDTAIEKICKPWIASDGREILVYYVSHRVKDRDIAFVVINICKSYNAGYTARLLEGSK